MKRLCYLVPLFLVWIAVVACAPITPSALPTLATPPTLEPGQDKQLNANPDFILMAGLSEDIRAVIEQVNDRNPNTLDEESFNEQNQFTIELGSEPTEVLTELFDRELKGTVEAHGQLTIARIGVLPKEGASDLELLLEAIQQVRLASAFLYANEEEPISLPVYAELDLATEVALPPSVSIDPNSVGAHPFGNLVFGPSDVAAFWQQWAFGPSGIGLLSGTGGTVASHPGCLGSGGSSGATPRVVVFDTVPSTLTNSSGNPVHILMGTGSVCPGDLDLTISQVVAPSTLVNTPTEYHGLFASALIHGVAPKAEIRLVSVLPPDGQGYLFDLLKGIMGETNAATTAIASSNPWKPTVFNFSLGIHPDARLTLQQQWDTALMVVQQLYPAVDLNIFRTHPLIDTDPGMNTPDFVYPDTEFIVQLVIWLTRRDGIIMVAASGNDQAGEQYPAAFLPVLGIGAYGPALMPGTIPVAACYSNMGDVYEPAGDSRTYGSPPCNSVLLSYCTASDCPNAVVSMIGWPGYWRTAFWSGTSFAAPFASGMVAVRLGNVTSAPPDASGAVDHLVSRLEDPMNCPMQIDSRCKLDLNKVLNVPYP